MKKLLKYIKFYRKESILSPIFKLLEASFELFVPLVVAAIIDKGIAGGDNDYIIRMSLLLVALAVIGLVCAITAQYYAAKASVGFVTGIRRDLFRHIQSLSFSDSDEMGTSTLITRMTSDVNQVQNGVNLTLRLLMRSPFVVFGAMIMAFTIDFKSALIFAAAIPLLLVVVFFIMLISIPLYKKVQQRLDGLLDMTRENLSGSRVIRAFCREREEISEFAQKNAEYVSTQSFVGRISALMNPLTYIIINFAVIAIIKVGAVRVDSGILTQGQVVALYNYMSQILVELIKLANLIINITKSVACGNRIQAIFDIKPSLTGGIGRDEEKTEIAVEFKNVSFYYKNSPEPSLKNISFTARRGETIGIIGGTGSGKSTLVNLIPRFYDATDGEVKVYGENVKNYTLEQIRKKVGIVPQKAVLFKGTIRENILWGDENAADSEIMQAIYAAQAKDIIEKKDSGLDAEVEQNGKNFSGGQRQRLTIARALVRKPDILILDDSSSALDFATDAALRQSIRTMDGSPTVFIVSQRASSIMNADKIIVLDNGEPVGIGTHGELLETCRVYKEIYDSQFKREGK
ncbi:MAG: ABC transporter ATP-binding protein [Firmicutes bacterium]|nr:ABC transporter ATP-binding protein [Bacillota bacterium]